MRWKRHMVRRSLNWNVDLIRRQLQRESSWWQSAVRMRMVSMHHTNLYVMKPNLHTRFTNCVSESENYVQSFWRSERRRQAWTGGWVHPLDVGRWYAVWNRGKVYEALCWRSQGVWHEAVCLMSWHHFDSNFRCSQKHTMDGAENTLRQTGKLYLLQPENSFPESSSSNGITRTFNVAMSKIERWIALWH